MSKLISLAEITRAIDLRADGNTWREVGEKLKRSPGGIRRAVIENSPEEHEEALEQFRDKLRQERRVRAFDRDDKWSAKFLDDLSLEQLPETRAARKSVNAPDPQEGRAAELADALERLNRILTAQAVQPALPPATTGVAE